MQQSFSYNNVIYNYVKKLNTKKSLVNYVDTLNQKIKNIEKNFVFLYNLHNQDQIILLEGIQNLNLKNTKSIKDQLLIFLFNANIPLSWIIDIVINLNDFLSSKNIIYEIPEHNDINIVYIRTINYVTKNKLKFLINNLKNLHTH
jgi:hypothetical protein